MPDPQNDIYATDSEDDDYVPPANDDGDSEDSDNPNEEEVAPVTEVVDEAERKRKRDELWSSFQASVSEPAKAVSQPPPEKMVKVERKHLFAGKEVVEIVEVPENSLDAKKWPIWTGEQPKNQAEPPVAQELPSGSPHPAPTEDTQAPLADAPTPIAEDPKPPTKPPTKRPGPRKPKTKLDDLPMPGKAKKLTTLDKSAMDWRAHLQAETEGGSSVKDELEANRRGGGYLEKVEFLKRVEDRKEDNLDSLKSAKRRRL